ncbi:hypothetical protein AB0F64_04685 [Streptomyces sp. NPDC026294]|uniref:hypothetical protein n=1 Tax=Streptomyces sp. NPDC026294 TaxID=3155362 RepID=UPI0033DF72F6
MLLRPIFTVLALLCALAVTALGVWRGDAWATGIGVFSICCAAVSVTLAWRARH